MSEIHHYTSLTALKGIISSGVMWASNVGFLNDDEEYKYAHKLLHEQLAARSQELEDHRRQVQELGLGVLPEVPHPYVMSFSKVCDALTLWRGYAPSKGRVCLSFDEAALRKVFRRVMQQVAKANGLDSLDYPNIQRHVCIYDLPKQRDAIEGLLKVLPIRRRAMVDSQYWYTVSHGVIERYFVATVSLKHPAFADEREVRYSFNELRYALPYKVAFRVSGSRFIPYMEVPIADTAGKIPLRRVTIGPSPSLERSQTSVRMLLNYAGYKHVDVTPSRVPFREW